MPSDFDDDPKSVTPPRSQMESFSETSTMYPTRGEISHSVNVGPSSLSVLPTPPSDLRFELELKNPPLNPIVRLSITV